MADDLDAETAALIARLTLEDLQAAPVDDPDARYAFQLHMQDLGRYLGVAHDSNIARVLEADGAYADRLQIAEDGLRDDYAYAEALNRGQPLPQMSQAQRALEDPWFLQDRIEADATAEAGDVVGQENDEGVVEILTEDEEPVNNECIVCGDELHRRARRMIAPCNHQYCLNCLVNLARASLTDETLFPLRCCRTNFIDRDIHSLVGRDLARQLLEKRREFGTLGMNRIYCPNMTCSAFLGSSEDILPTICHRCDIHVCKNCKQIAHDGEPCEENHDGALAQVRQLAASEHWQTCPGCQELIELAHGCYHMTCKCRTEFCYVCAALWKNCTCPQWEENRLLVTAEERVRNELGHRQAGRMGADAFWVQVQERVDRLRVNHDCDVHVWRRRNGGGQCPECRHHLRDYLLQCRQCTILACVRCSRNRF